MSKMPPEFKGRHGHYRVIAELNRGATAIVYEGVQLERNLRVALKVMMLRSETKEHIANIERAVQREVTSASSIRHPNVVQLLDVIQDSNESLVLVWELVHGQDLLDLVNSCGGCIPPAKAAFYFQQLVRAVEFMHAHGFCHRDLKAENCMVDFRTETLKVIDFGLSKHLDSAVTLGVGTLDYMSPELLAAAGARTGQYDARAVDIWSLGVLLYLVTTGRYPFEDPRQRNHPKSTLLNIVNGRMQPVPPSVPAACAGLIHKMLQPQPQRRVLLADILQDPWLRDASLSVAKDIYRATGEFPLALMPLCWLSAPMQRHLVGPHAHAPALYQSAAPPEPAATPEQRPGSRDAAAAPAPGGRASPQSANTRDAPSARNDSAMTEKGADAAADEMAGSCALGLEGLKLSAAEDGSHAASKSSPLKAAGELPGAERERAPASARQDAASGAGGALQQRAEGGDKRVKRFAGVPVPRLPSLFGTRQGRGGDCCAGGKA